MLSAAEIISGRVHSPDGLSGTPAVSAQIPFYERRTARVQEKIACGILPRARSNSICSALQCTWRKNGCSVWLCVQRNAYAAYRGTHREGALAACKGVRGEMHMRYAEVSGLHRKRRTTVNYAKIYLLNKKGRRLFVEGNTDFVIALHRRSSRAV